MTDKAKSSVLEDAEEASAALAAAAPETRLILRALLKGVIVGAQIAERSGRETA